MSESMNSGLKVLVSGATGNQGGAVATSLLERGHKVRALTRNTGSARAKALAAQGAEVIAGDMNDNDSIRRALQGVDSFYLMGSPFEAGVEAETEQGIRLSSLAREENIGHLVYGSVADADKATRIPHFDSKYKVEEYIKSLGINYSISAPVYFMDNLVAPWATDALKAGQIMMAMPEDMPLQQISVKNIGDFVASLVSRRDSVFGKRYDIAGDELNAYQMTQHVSAALARPMEYVSLAVDALKQQDADMGRMFEWFIETGYDVDIAALHAEFDDVPWQTYTNWIESIDLGAFKAEVAHA